MKRHLLQIGLLCTLPLASGCDGESGLLRLDIVTAPGSDLADRVTSARITLSNPPTVIESERDANGKLLLDLEVVAEGQAGTLTLEGFDDSDQLIAIGRTPLLPIAAIDADISLYIGRPNNFDQAPVDLDPARDQIAVARLPYGIALAGGRDSNAEPTVQVEIYNAYDHELQVGLDLPEARTDLTAISGSSSSVYLFGGRDALGEARAEAWRFDTSIAPAGLIANLASDEALARSGASAAHVGNDVFLVTGDPAVVIDSERAVAIPDSPALTEGVALALTTSISTPPVLIVGAGVGSSGAVRFSTSGFEELAGPPELLRRGHTLLRLADGTALIVGGTDMDGEPLASALVFEPTSNSFTVIEDFLATPRKGAAIAATSSVIVVAGGRSSGGQLRADAELFDAQDLAPMGSAVLGTARVNAVAARLPTDQLIIIGGVGANGLPIAAIELFSPGL